VPRPRPSTQTIIEQLRAISSSQIENHQVIGPAFATVRDLVLQHGRLFTRKALPRGQWLCTPQACYANALSAALTDGWAYVEGFATPRRGALAVLHAWVINPKNPAVAYDPTWPWGHEYFGIPFRLDYVLGVHGKTGHPGVLDAWELGWPLLRGEDRIADALWNPAMLNP